MSILSKKMSFKTASKSLLKNDGNVFVYPDCYDQCCIYLYFADIDKNIASEFLIDTSQADENDEQIPEEILEFGEYISTQIYENLLIN